MILTDECEVAHGRSEGAKTRVESSCSSRVSYIIFSHACTEVTAFFA